MIVSVWISLENCVEKYGKFMLQNSPFIAESLELQQPFRAVAPTPPTGIFGGMYLDGEGELNQSRPLGATFRGVYGALRWVE